MATDLTAAVGTSQGVPCPNRPADVQLVKRLLNAHAKRIGLSPLLDPADPRCGPRTVKAIEDFQRSVMGKGPPFGRVQPTSHGGSTLKALLRGADAGGGAADRPFQDRLAAFLADAKAAHGVTIPAGTEFRKPGDAQRWHVAHMICFNSFGHLSPAKSQAVGGRNLIAWTHLSSAATAWQHVAWEDFLRDAAGRTPVKKGAGWAVGQAPDEAKTRQRARDVLTAAGIGKAKDRTEPHSAMVAPGYQGCAEPCRCGGNRSNHIAGAASDLGQTQLALLGEKLKQAKAGSLDDYLRTFGLHRPMQSEPWHVEATPR